MSDTFAKVRFEVVTAHVTTFKDAEGNVLFEVQIPDDPEIIVHTKEQVLEVISDYIDWPDEE